MAYLDTYLNTIIERGNIELAESIRKTAEDVGNSNIKNFSYVTHEIGLLFGNVQSGKTGQVFGIISKAADMEPSRMKAKKNNATSHDGVFKASRPHTVCAR